MTRLKSHPPERSKRCRMARIIAIRATVMGNVSEGQDAVEITRNLNSALSQLLWAE